MLWLLVGFAVVVVLFGRLRGLLWLEGLVFAGIVIAALGVLDDLTVSQSSAVTALRRANPGGQDLDHPDTASFAITTARNTLATA